MYFFGFFAVAGMPICALITDSLGIPDGTSRVLEFIVGGGAFVALMKVLWDTRDELKKEREQNRLKWEAAEAEWKQIVKDNTQVQASFLQWLKDLEEGAFCLYRAEKTLEAKLPPHHHHGAKS